MLSCSPLNANVPLISLANALARHGPSAAAGFGLLWRQTIQNLAKAKYPFFFFFLVKRGVFTTRWLIGDSFYRHRAVYSPVGEEGQCSRHADIACRGTCLRPLSIGTLCLLSVQITALSSLPLKLWQHLGNLGWNSSSVQKPNSSKLAMKPKACKMYLQIRAWERGHLWWNSLHF